jgi:RNA polymerase sigma-70 factor (ECF subfamily)
MFSQAKPVAGEDALADIQLAEAVAAGDHDAFRTLMQRHNRLLYRTARSIVKDDSDAEDAVQNAYLLAYRKIGKFRGEAKLSTWLVRIVVNEALACLRKRSRSAHVVSLDGAELDDAIELAADPVKSKLERPEETLIRADMRRLIESKIDELPLAYRAVFMLRALEELSVPEAAAALGIPEATVRTRFFRARARLRESLAPGSEESFDTAFAFAGERCSRIIRHVLAAIAQSAVPASGFLARLRRYVARHGLNAPA